MTAGAHHLRGRGVNPVQVVSPLGRWARYFEDPGQPTNLIAAIAYNLGGWDEAELRNYLLLYTKTDGGQMTVAKVDQMTAEEIGEVLGYHITNLRVSGSGLVPWDKQIFMYGENNRYYKLSLAKGISAQEVVDANLMPRWQLVKAKWRDFASKTSQYSFVLYYFAFFIYIFTMFLFYSLRECFERNVLLLTLLGVHLASWITLPLLAVAAVNVVLPLNQAASKRVLLANCLGV